MFYSSPLEWDEHGSKATARNDPSQVVPYFEMLLIIDVEMNGGPLTVAAFLSGHEHPSFKVQTQKRELQPRVKRPDRERSQSTFLLYCLPGVAMTKDHKLSDLKQQKVTLSSGSFKFEIKVLARLPLKALGRILLPFS